MQPLCPSVVRGVQSIPEHTHDRGCGLPVGVCSQLCSESSEILGLNRALYVFSPSLVPLCPAGPQTPGKSRLTALSVCLCHPHPLLSIPLSLFNLEEQHSKQLLPLSRLSEVRRHKGQEGQLQPSALTSCLTRAREFHPVIPASSPYLLFELESTT